MFISKQGTWPELKDFDKFFVGFEDHIKRIQQAHDGIQKTFPTTHHITSKRLQKISMQSRLQLLGLQSQILNSN